MSYVNNYQDCITPGHYVMTIPEGYILLGEEQTPCTPLVIEFEVVEPEPTVIEISPANGSTVSMLNCATISFPELAQVDLGRYPSMKMEKVTLQDGVENLITIGGAYGMSSFERLSDNSFRAIFNGLATADGTYRLTLNSNSFVFESGFNLETTVDVQFTAPEAPAYEMTPDNSEALPKLQKFTITFPEESVVYVNTLLSNNTSTLYKGEEIIRDGYGYITNPLVGSTGFYSPVEGTTNSFSFTLGSAGLDEGKYVLMIPAGVFLMGEDENNFNQGISIVYECNGEGLDKLEVTPSIPVRELTSMEITYVNETSISFQSSYPGFSFYKYVEGQTYGTWVEYMGSDNVRIEGNTLYLTLSNPVTEEGVYYIEISNYSLYLSDGETTSTPQKVYFTVDPNAEPVSVESIASEQTDNRIYTITGIEVKEMTAPGLYIVNGKKIVVR